MLMTAVADDGDLRRAVGRGVWLGLETVDRGDEHYPPVPGVIMCRAAAPAPRPLSRTRALSVASQASAVVSTIDVDSDAPALARYRVDDSEPFDAGVDRV